MHILALKIRMCYCHAPKERRFSGKAMLVLDLGDMSVSLCNAKNFLCDPGQVI